MGKNYYEILGLTKEANEDAIRKAYKKLAYEYHPDRNKTEGAEEKFKEISQAYKVLSNPEQKSIYDKLGEEGLEGVDGFSTNFNPTDFFQQFFGGNFGQMFKEEDNVPPVEFVLELTLEEIFCGCSKNITVDRFSTCTTCNNSIKKCNKCMGNGILRLVVNNRLQQISCTSCGGSGRENGKDACKKCNSIGFIKEKHTLNINVPVGVHKTKPIIIKNEGNQIPKEEIKKPEIYRSDIMVMVVEKEHPIFNRGSVIKEIQQLNPNNLVTDISITLEESLCGFNKSIKYLDGKNIKIVTGNMVKNNDILVMKGFGMTKYNSNDRGDLLIKIKVEPRELNKTQKEQIWKVLSNKEYNYINKNTSNIVLFDDYKQEQVEEFTKESIKDKYRRRKHQNRQEDSNEDDGANVQCATQ